MYPNTTHFFYIKNPVNLDLKVYIHELMATKAIEHTLFHFFSPPPPSTPSFSLLFLFRIWNKTDLTLEKEPSKGLRKTYSPTGRSNYSTHVFTWTCTRILTGRDNWWSWLGLSGYVSTVICNNHDHAYGVLVISTACTSVMLCMRTYPCIWLPCAWSVHKHFP